MTVLTVTVPETAAILMSMLLVVDVLGMAVFRKDCCLFTLQEG